MGDSLSCPEPTPVKSPRLVETTDSLDTHTDLHLHSDPPHLEPSSPNSHSGITHHGNAPLPLLALRFDQTNPSV
ncbi:hypothetical protein V6N13_072043 [Hibiscus sabdariffa]